MCTWLSSWNRTIHTYLFDLMHLRDITMSGLGGLRCQNGGLCEKCLFWHRIQWPFCARTGPLLALSAALACAFSFAVTTFLTSLTVRGTSVEYWLTR